MATFLLGFLPTLLSLFSPTNEQNFIDLQKQRGIQANSLTSANVDGLDNISWIFDQASNAIRFISGDNVYLNADRLMITKEGALLRSDDNHDALLLPALFSGPQGLHIQIDQIDIFGIWVCTNCGYKNSRFVNACQKCHRSRDE